MDTATVYPRDGLSVRFR